MPCYSPLYAYVGKVKPNGKLNIVWRRSESPEQIRQDLPCGRCIGCRLERSRQWAMRCVHEASLHKENSFITLTYDKEHLPPGGSLVLSDFQKFMKRLRKSVAPKRVRFYHCGEYGEALGRPHYHALLFGHDFGDKSLFSARKEIKTYTSQVLSELWPKGFSVIGDVTFDSAAYVARYVMKKITGPSADFHYGGLKPEYTTMSRRPGIAAGWYDKFKSDVYPSDFVVMNGKKLTPPRFYDNLLAREDSDLLDSLKLKRASRIDWWDNSCFRLPVREKVKLASVKSLIRPLED